LNEKNQEELTKDNAILNKKLQEGRDLELKLNEDEQLAGSLRYRASHLDEVTGAYAKEFGAMKRSQKEIDVLQKKK